MKRLLIPLFVLLTLPSVVNSSHLNNQRELIVTSESTRESIELAKYLKDNGVVKYSAYWCPNCLNQSELFGIGIVAISIGLISKKVIDYPTGGCMRGTQEITFNI